VAWIEAHQELANHPKTKKLAYKLSLNKPSTIGSLILLWWWAIDYAPDGDLSKFDSAIIADVMCYRGKNPDKLISALIESGFINENMTIHDWDQYGGKLILAREESRERAKIRKQNQRERYKNNNVTRDKPVTDAGQSSDIAVTDVGQTPCHGQNSKRTEEKRTEQYIDSNIDILNTPKVINNKNNTSVNDVVFKRFWDEYPKKVAKQDAIKAWKKLKLTDELAEKIISAVKAQSASEQWTKDNGQYIPNPSTWLNRGQWDDEVKTAASKYRTEVYR
jgi:hypothetical protein